MADESAQVNPTNRRNRVGCGAVALALGAAAIAGGVYLMNRWDALGGAARAGAVALVVIGTLLVLPVLVLLLLKLVVILLFRRMTKQLAKAGADMVGFTKAMYGALHEFRAARDEDFASLDRAIYDSTRHALESLGFRYLGDVVDATIEQQGTMAVIRA